MRNLKIIAYERASGHQKCRLFPVGKRKGGGGRERKEFFGLLAWETPTAGGDRKGKELNLNGMGEVK